MMAELHEMGFEVMLWVCPYIRPDGQHFKELVLNEDGVVWLRSAEDPRWPALMHWWNGFSAVIEPDGTVVERTAVSEQAVIEAPVELRDGRTWAVRVGLWPVLVTAAAVWAWAVAVGVRSRRAPSPDRR